MGKNRGISVLHHVFEIVVRASICCKRKDWENWACLVGQRGGYGSDVQQLPALLSCAKRCCTRMLFLGRNTHTKHWKNLHKEVTAAIMGGDFIQGASGS